MLFPEAAQGEMMGLLREVQAELAKARSDMELLRISAKQKRERNPSHPMLQGQHVVFSRGGCSTGSATAKERKKKRKEAPH